MVKLIELIYLNAFGINFASSFSLRTDDDGLRCLHWTDGINYVFKLLWLRSKALVLDVLC